MTRRISSLFQSAAVAHFRNPAARRRCPSSSDKILDSALRGDAVREISRWPNYNPTPLISLDGFASACGVAAVYYKDESARFGLGSFKALGGAFAVQCALAEKFSLAPSSVRLGRLGKRAAAVTVATATDGNHGRSVAWGAKRFGCRCIIYIHQKVSEGRKNALEKLGAKVVRIKGDYDESARQAAADAKNKGWILVADTSPKKDDITTRRVMAGYGVIAAEARRQLPKSPTHIIVPGGVGGLAAGLIAEFWSAKYSRPRFIIAESNRADCLFQSAKNGQPTAVKIKKETMMAGLSCGEISRPAWEIVRPGADDFVAVPDALVAPAMRLAASGMFSDSPLTAGECAVAGHIILLAAMRRPNLFCDLELNRTSRILLIGTEGATDPQIYRRIVGIR